VEGRNAVGLSDRGKRKHPPPRGVLRTGALDNDERVALQPVPPKGELGHFMRDTNYGTSDRRREWEHRQLHNTGAHSERLGGTGRPPGQCELQDLTGFAKRRLDSAKGQSSKMATSERMATILEQADSHSGAVQQQEGWEELPPLTSRIQRWERRLRDRICRGSARSASTASSFLSVALTDTCPPSRQFVSPRPPTIPSPRHPGLREACHQQIMGTPRSGDDAHQSWREWADAGRKLGAEPQGPRLPGEWGHQLNSYDVTKVTKRLPSHHKLHPEELPPAGWAPVYRQREVGMFD